MDVRVCSLAERPELTDHWRGRWRSVLADLDHDHAVYVEPNFWVRHDLR